VNIVVYLTNESINSPIAGAIYRILLHRMLEVFALAIYRILLHRMLEVFVLTSF